MIDIETAKRVMEKYGLATFYGGYGLGVCSFANSLMTRPILGLWNESDIPTEQELEQIRSYQEFKIRSYYNAAWQEKLLAMKPPQDEGVNTLFFWKGFRGEPGVWAYRRITWEYGPSFVDRKKNGHRLLSVASMITRIEDIIHEQFAKWKKEHAQTFAKVS